MLLSRRIHIVLYCPLLRQHFYLSILGVIQNLDKWVSPIHSLVGQEGFLVMTQKKINTLTGCPKGKERGSGGWGGFSTCTSFWSPWQELLKAPSAPMWGWPISLSYWVNRDKSNAVEHQRPGGQRKNRSQLVLLTEAGAWPLRFTRLHSWMKANGKHWEAAPQLIR